eukprot:scaffold44_cov411-Prasinococcus_capsulatus_cf.AAC.12
MCMAWVMVSVVPQQHIPVEVTAPQLSEPGGHAAPLIEAKELEEAEYLEEAPLEGEESEDAERLEEAPLEGEESEDAERLEEAPLEGEESEDAAHPEDVTSLVDGEEPEDEQLEEDEESVREAEAAKDRDTEIVWARDAEELVGLCLLLHPVFAFCSHLRFPPRHFRQEVGEGEDAPMFASGQRRVLLNAYDQEAVRVSKGVTSTSHGLQKTYSGRPLPNPRATLVPSCPEQKRLWQNLGVSTMVNFQNPPSLPGERPRVTGHRQLTDETS